MRDAYFAYKIASALCLAKMVSYESSKKLVMVLITCSLTCLKSKEESITLNRSEYLSAIFFYACLIIIWKSIGSLSNRSSVDICLALSRPISGDKSNNNVKSGEGNLKRLDKLSIIENSISLPPP